MRETLHMITVLGLICAISGFSLSFLKEETAPIIAEQILINVQGPAVHKVFSPAENDPLAERKVFTLEDGRSVTVFPYKKNGAIMGVALENTGPGYGGDIGVIVGFDLARDTLLGIGITESKETPGIGSAVAEPRFAGQFAGKALAVELSSKGGNIDAISGATISSTGTIIAVQNAAADYKSLKNAIINAWK